MKTTVPSSPEDETQSTTAQETLEVLTRLERLKQIPRTGWLLRGVRQNDADSVADHTALTGIVSVILGHLLQKEGVDVDLGLLARIAVFHDLAEVITGDLDRENLKVFGDNFRAQKHIAEDKVLHDLFSEIRNIPEIGTSIQSLLQSTSVETQVVKIADRIEACLQAIVFIEGGYSKKLFAPFFKDLTAIQSTVPWKTIQGIMASILKQYESF